jgi:hypothetical protein
MEPRSRHGKLSKLVGTAFFQVGRNIALENARLQYGEANPSPATPLAEHLAEFDELWSGLERKWLAKLSTSERLKFDALPTDHWREAFRIVRNWSQADSPDFKIVRDRLAERLGVSKPTGSNIRRRFCALGILRKTADYVPHKLACRYQWILQGARLKNESRLRKGFAVRSILTSP